MKKKHTAIAMVSVLLWCFSGICFRKGALGLDVFVSLSLMTGVGVITATLIQFLRGDSLRSLLQLPAKAIVAGFFGVAFYTLILAYAFAIAPASDVGQVNLLNYLWPLWIVIFSIILLGHRPRLPLLLAGVVLGFSGVLVSRGLGNIAHLPGSFLPHLLALLGGMLWALYSVLLKYWNIPEENGGTSFHFGLCAVISALLALLTGKWNGLASLNAETAFWILFGGIGPVGLAYYFWEIGMKKGNIRLIASLAYFIPIGSSVLIGLIFREALNGGLFLGGFLIAAGAILTQRADRRVPPATSSRP